jgi:glyceraldehyde-3-phosphate dehydrogenase (NADP+)
VGITFDVMCFVFLEEPRRRKDSAVSTLSVKAALRSFSIRTLVACAEDDKDLMEEVISGGHSSFSSMNYIL